MTLRERAQQFIDTVALYHLDTQGKVDTIAELILADRQALQSEIVNQVERMISSADRIATLHEWQARDALTIQQLNQSNNLLSEKIAQLEKEKHELTQEITKSHFRGCHCEHCERSRQRPAS